MRNKKIKTLISFSITLMLSSNIAFAKIIKIQKPVISTDSTSDVGDKIQIVKDQGLTSTVSFDSIEDTRNSEGNQANGHHGVTVAAAYLTPAKKFGYIYVEKYDYKDGGGKVIAHIDELNSSKKWGGDVNKKNSSLTANNRLFVNARDYFVDPKGPIASSISNLDEKKLDSYLVQKDNNGKKFVAATFYVRYTYDFKDGHDWGGYLKSSPVLKGNTTYTNGPYIALGDYFDYKMDVIKGGDTTRKLISDNYGTYFTKLSKLVTSTLNLNKTGLKYDYNPVSAGDGNYVKTNTKQAMLEKRFEYRRYITTKTETIKNENGFEFVYPVTNKTVKTQSVIPDIVPTASIKATTEYYNSSKTRVNRYRIDVSITTKSYSNLYSEKLKTYTIRKASDRPTNEPRQDQMDLWHSDVTAYIDVVDSSGNSKLFNKKQISPDTKVVYINLDEIKPNYNGIRSLDNCTAKLIVNFKNNARFVLTQKIYSYLYKLDGAEKTYNQVIKYIDSKNSGLQLKTDIKKYEESTDPREELTYKTETSSFKSIEATSGISAITTGDYAKTMVSVDVEPPQTLTVLEGSDFNAIVNINTNGIPIGYTGADKWISDFKIDSLTITSASGDLVYRENNIPISPSPASSTFTKEFNHLTAKPTHVGIADIVVKYSYNINVQRYHTEIIEYTDENDELQWTYVTVADPLEITPQNGTAYNEFKIYSLTANTVN